MQCVSEWKSFGGYYKRYQHTSQTLQCDMHFTIYLPPQADTKQVPVVYWLSGLTCTDENFVLKSGAQRIASELGLALLICDTSPRGEGVFDIPNNEAIGFGAGFYLNATQAPWNTHYQMYDYVVGELPELVKANFPVSNQWSISGHSMGGHGAMTIALKNPQMFQSLSVFAPVCHPSATPKGRWRFQQYLGHDESTWAAYDTCLLIPQAEKQIPILMDQGSHDVMIDNLKPDALKQVCEENKYPLDLRLREGYDHGYFFVATFIEEHLRYHAKALFAE